MEGLSLEEVRHSRLVLHQPLLDLARRVLPFVQGHILLVIIASLTSEDEVVELRLSSSTHRKHMLNDETSLSNSTIGTSLLMDTKEPPNMRGSKAYPLPSLP